MVGQTGDKRLMIFWYAEPVGWMVRRKERVEKTMESASAYETDVANLHRAIQFRRTGIPKSTPARRILDRKLRTKDVIVGHGWWQKRRGTQKGNPGTYMSKLDYKVC
jgi:hypothetical protein